MNFVSCLTRLCVLIAVFIEVDEFNPRIQFIFSTREAAERIFSLKISQIRDFAAPHGCLQYFTSVEGTISTFNYEDNSQVQLYRRPSYFVS